MCTVAWVLSVADPDKVVNLGAKATEARAKALSASGALARARVVHFATHVLVAGETAMLAANHAELGTAVDPAQNSEEGGRRVAHRLRGHGPEARRRLGDPLGLQYGGR